MRMRLQPVAILGLLILATSAQGQVSDVTLKCQKVIAKAVEKFVDKVADPIEKCLLAVQKCNTKADPADVEACIGKLLVVGKGKCAVGKLAGNTLYYDYVGGTAASNDPTQGSINKALGKFVSSLSKCDIPNVEFAYLGRPTPNDAFELADYLNRVRTFIDPEPAGAACVAHKRVHASFPNVEDLLLIVGSHPDSGNFPNEVAGALFPEVGECK